MWTWSYKVDRRQSENYDSKLLTKFDFQVEALYCNKPITCELSSGFG